VLLALVAALACGVLVLLGTPIGAQVAWNLASGAAGGFGIDLNGQISGTVLGGLRLQNVSVRQSGADGSALQLRLASLELAWQPKRLLDGQVQIDRLALQGLDGSYRSGNGPEPPPGEPLTQDGLRQMLFELPVAIALDELSATGIAFEVDGTAVGTDSLDAALRLDSEAAQVSRLVWRWQDYAVDGVLSLRRNLDMAGDLEWRARVSDLDYAGALVIGGSLDNLALAHTLDAPQTLTTSGTVIPGIFAGQTPTLALRHESAAFSLAPWGVDDLSLSALALDTNGTPEDLRASGSVVVHYPDVPDTTATLALRWQNDTLTVEELRADNTELALAVTGTVVPEPLAATIDWTLERLDPSARLPQLSLTDVSGNGSVHVEQGADGMLTDVQLTRLQGTLDGRPLNAQGSASLRDAVLTQLDLQAGNGDNLLQLEGSADGALDFTWNLRFPDLTRLWSDAGGSIEGSGTIAGTPQAPAVEGDLNAQTLSLVLADQRLTLQSLTLDATHRDDGSSDLSLDITALRSEAQGTVQTLLDAATLSLSGTPEAHTLQTTLQSAYGDLTLALRGGVEQESWNGTLNTLALASDYGDWTLRDSVDLQVSAERQQMDRLCLDYRITSLCAELQGTAAAGMQIQVDLSGLPLDWANRDAPGKPPAIQMWQDALAANLPQGLAVEGALDAAVTVNGLQGSAWQRLQLQVRPRDVVLQLTRENEAELQSLEPDVQRFRFDDVTVDVDNEADDWRAQLNLAVADAAATASTPLGSLRADVSLLRGSDLGGTVSFDFNDLSLVESFVPMVRDARGALNGFAELDGTLEAPQVRAQVGIADASLNVPEYGLELTGISLQVRSTSDNVVTAQLQASSGEGSMTLDATLTDPLEDTRALQASLTGERFAVMALPQAQVAVSPDVQLTYGGNSVNIGGNVTVERSHIDLSRWVGELGSGGVGVSRDVVVVRQAGDVNLGDENLEPLAVSINLGLRIGDVVTVSGYGLDVSIGGQLDLEQEPGQTLLAYGELSIPEGTYEIYNQKLSTRNGRILFFGNPTNPVLDLRASRQTDTAEVGLQLSGTVKRMQGQLYSTPTLPEGEILALLVTGKSFNNVGSQDGDALLSAITTFGIDKSQGLTNAVGDKLGLDSVSVNSGSNLQDSSLGLGKYLTPRLLMRYEVGLFDRQFVLSLAYALTEHIKLEVETGVSQSVDVSYTVEKD